MFRGLQGRLQLLALLHARLLSDSISEGTKKTYAQCFSAWIIWRTVRGAPLLLSRFEPEAWEDELCDFYAHGGYTMGYSFSYMQNRLYAVRRFHHLHRIPIDITSNGMPYLAIIRKGVKVLSGPVERKIAVSPDLLIDVYENAGLDFDKWDDLITWFAILLGFFFLLRCSEYLDKGPVDMKKCVKERHLRALRDKKPHHLPAPIDADEAALRQDFHKNDRLGQGTDNNVKLCKKEPRLCLVTVMNKLRKMKPTWLMLDENIDKCLLTKSNGKVVKKDHIVKLLREAGIRKGLDPSILSSHSLRAGGCTAIWFSRKCEHTVQRRGKWTSTCWKQYTWPGRSEDDDLASDMATASCDIFAHLRNVVKPVTAADSA